MFYLFFKNSFFPVFCEFLSVKLACNFYFDYFRNKKTIMLNQEANVHITFRPSVDSRYIRPEHRAILEKACLQSGNLHPVITSGYRNISRQVRIMYDNLIRDYAGQRRLYLSAGAELIDTYDQCLEKGFSREMNPRSHDRKSQGNRSRKNLAALRLRPVYSILRPAVWRIFPISFPRSGRWRKSVGRTASW